MLRISDRHLGQPEPEHVTAFKKAFVGVLTEEGCIEQTHRIVGDVFQRALSRFEMGHALAIQAEEEQGLTDLSALLVVLDDVRTLTDGNRELPDAVEKLENHLSDVDMTRVLQQATSLDETLAHRIRGVMYELQMGLAALI